MGRAIDVDRRLDSLEGKVSEILSVLDELSKTNSKQKQVDLHKETKPVEEKNGKKDKGNNPKNSSKK